MVPQACEKNRGAEAAEIGGRIESHVLARLGGRVRYLCVVVVDGGLVLRGRTPTYHAKQLAQHAAMEVGGLPVLSNEIEVG